VSDTSGCQPRFVPNLKRLAPRPTCAAAADKRL